MRSILRGRNVIPDTWHYADEDGWGDVSDVIVPLARFLAETDAWTARTGRVGVKLIPTDEVSVLAPHLPKLGIIVVDFPAFGDGRGYSQARLLRQRLRYQGELRAAGVVKQDQVFFMARTGFDSFQLAPGESSDAAVKAFGTFTAAYQDGSETLFTLKRRAAATS